jgi:hypothetical protein
MRASAKSRFDVLDAGLDRGDLGPELGDVPFGDLPPAAIVGECGLAASEGLGDRLIFVVEPIGAPVDRDEAPIDGREPPAREFDEVLGSGARHDGRASARLAPCSGPAPAARLGDTAR